jgi:inosose dehydratase
MKLGHQTNTRGVVGHPAGVTSIKDLFYLSCGETETCVREVATAGFAGVEFFDGNVVNFPGGPSALAGLLAELELTAVAVYSGANFIFPEILPEELWRIERAAAAAAELAAPHLVVGGGARRAAGGTASADHLLLGRGLDRVVEIAASYGLVASFHPHLGTCVESREAIDLAFANSPIHFCPDTAHLAAGGSDNLELLTRYADRIEYVHIKDYVPEPFGFVPLGEGHLDIAAIIRLLEELGYDGWLMVECDGYPGDPLAAAETSKRYLDDFFAGTVNVESV